MVKYGDTPSREGVKDPEIGVWNQIDIRNIDHYIHRDVYTQTKETKELEEEFSSQPNKTKITAERQ